MVSGSRLGRFQSLLGPLHLCRLKAALLYRGRSAKLRPSKPGHGTSICSIPRIPVTLCFGMKHTLPSLTFCLALSVASNCAADQPQPLGKQLIQPFDFHGVVLQPGPLQAQVDEVRAFYLAIPDDDLLKGFRARAGLPAPGQDLGGWYSSDTFLVFGQIVSGLARLYAATGDAACRTKANHLLAEWAKCIEPDGYFYASRKPNAPHYIYDKMLWGLLDSYLYCGNQEALTPLSRITDWAVKNLDRSRRVNDTSTEWYTLSENLYRAYLATGDEKYRQFAEVWEYHAYWDIYARGGDIFAPRPDGGRNEAYHAYSHVNTLGGAGAAFLVKGEPAYLATIRNAADYLQARQCFATGGFGPDEELVPREKLIRKLADTHNTFETQCGSWAVFKLARYLISCTGDARYGDWVERVLYNGIGASIPMTPDGRVFYYSDYCLHGGAKRNTDFGWSCCTGTRPQAIAEAQDLIYFHDHQNLYVNLFTPSVVTWSNATNSVRLTQTTSFPENDNVHLTLALSRPAEFGLKLRVPAWLAARMSARINGHNVKAHADANHWLVLRRTWKDGDEIALRLPMKLWASPLTPDRPTPAAALFGPVVLAFQAPNARTLRSLNPAALHRALVPVKGQPLRFRFKSDPAVRVLPFFAIPAATRYFMYLDPNMGWRLSAEDIRFTGPWHSAGALRYCNEVGAAAECEFEGKGVRWLGWRFDDGGRAEVTIDRQVVGVVDQYGPGRELPFDWTSRKLSAGKHILRLRLLPDKDEHSKDHYLNVRGFEVLDEGK